MRFDYLVGEELRKWIDQAAERQGKRFAKTALNEFTAGAGEDLASILGALEQVCAYVGKSPEIDLEAVRAIVQAAAGRQSVRHDRRHYGRQHGAARKSRRKRWWTKGNPAWAFWRSSFANCA